MKRCHLSALISTFPSIYTDKIYDNLVIMKEHTILLVFLPAEIEALKYISSKNTAAFSVLYSLNQPHCHQFNK